MISEYGYDFPENKKQAAGVLYEALKNLVDVMDGSTHAMYLGQAMHEAREALAKAEVQAAYRHCADCLCGCGRVAQAGLYCSR